MTKPPELPPRVFAKGRTYYLVTAQGKKRIWTPLTKIRDGIPALYRKLADMAARDIAPDRMPALITDWLDEVSKTRSDKTQANDKWVMSAISSAFAEFRASQVTPPDCAAFLKPYRAKPRTHNEMRAGLRELMRFAEEKGHRDAGSNPVTSIKTLSTPARQRYPTDSEVRRIKVAAFYGNDGKRTSTGPMLAAIIDLAYLTGQRVSDVLDIRWHKLAALDAKGEVCAPYIGKDGIYFKPSKTEKTTGAKVVIQWSPRLKAVIERLRGMETKHPAFVVTSQEGQQYRYGSFKSPWQRALKRSGVRDLHFHDLRAKALTDTEERQGMKAAQTQGTHSTEQQTIDYVRRRKAQKSEATR